MIILTEALLHSTWEKPGHAAFKSLLCNVYGPLASWLVKFLNVRFLYLG